MRAVLLLAVTLLCAAQLHSQITFQETLGAGREDVPNSISPTKDSGFFIAGYTEVFTYAWQRKLMMIRLDKNGDTLWQRSFGGANAEEAMRGRQISTGFAAVGYTSSYRCNMSDQSMYLFVADTNGTEVTSMPYCYGSDNLVATDFVELEDSSLVILGHTYDRNDITTRDMFLMRVVKILDYYDTVWVRRYSIPGADWGISLDKTSDGGFVIAGETQGQPSHPGLVIKTDSAGNLMWSRAIPTQAWQGMYTLYFSCRQTPDGGYIVAGETWVVSGNNMEILLLKLDSNGVLMWSESIRPASATTNCNVYPTSIEVLSDGGFILSNIFMSTNAMDDNFVVRTDSAGQVLWSMRYGGPNNERIANPETNSIPIASGSLSSIAVHEPTNGSPRTYGLTSFTKSFIPTSNVQDIYVTKFTEGGYTGCDTEDYAVAAPQAIYLDSLPVQVIGLQIVPLGHTQTAVYMPSFSKNVICTSGMNISENTPIDFYIWPNPVGDILRIQHHSNEQVFFTITDMLGQTIITSKQTGEESTIDVSSLTPGVYFVTQFENGVMGTHKFVKQ